MTTTITDFDFGITGTYTVPTSQPDPSDYVAYTVWHVSRALHYHNTNPNVTIEPILQKYRPALKIQRAIQPIQRVRRGNLVNLGPAEPERTEQAAAILLYALHPGHEDEKCTACSSHASSGPFAHCISGGLRWTTNACICCYYTGTGNKCNLAKQHYLHLYRNMRDQGKIPVTFPANAERNAPTVDLQIWKTMILEEKKRRILLTAKVMGDRSSPTA